MTVGRREASIDLMALKALGHQARWNQWLARCLRDHDIRDLQRVLYGIEAGMTDLAAKRLNSPEMIQFFIRLQRSIWKTMQRIVRQQAPNPCDNPDTADPEALDEKRERDHAFEREFLKSGF